MGQGEGQQSIGVGPVMAMHIEASYSGMRREGGEQLGDSLRESRRTILSTIREVDSRLLPGGGGGVLKQGLVSYM